MRLQGGDGAVRWGSEECASLLAALTGQKRLAITHCERLSGGAIQQNFVLDVAPEGVGAGAGVGAGVGARERWVLRTASASRIAASRAPAQEYAVLRAAHDAGVATPRPVAFRAGDAQWPAFIVMAFVDGDASGHRLTRDARIVDGAALVAAIGANLARVHAIAPPQSRLECLGAVPANPTRDALDGYRKSIDHWRAITGDARPVLAWTLRWLEARIARQEASVLVHRDYRVGNLLVDGQRLAATLDWEFAGWGNPLEDLGWFCAPCWRFARPDRGAGGLAAIDDFLRGYNAAADTRHAAEDLVTWQVLAQLRWAVIALQQTLRFLESGERSLELALTGRLLPELEWQMLELTGDRLA